MKATEELTWLNEVSSVPLQQAIRHQQAAYAAAISDCGWGTFRRMLEYKAARAGRRVIVIDRWYPSSKTCSACGYVLADLKNILAAGLAVTACGADVRHPGTSRVQSAVKQEPRPARAGIPVLQGGE
jgi:putative transposase